MLEKHEKFRRLVSSLNFQMAISNYFSFSILINQSGDTVVTEKTFETFFSFCFSVVKAACERIKKPITCKIRIYDTIEKTVEYAKRLEKAGAKVSILLKVLCI